MTSNAKITMLCAVLVISVLCEPTVGLFRFDWGSSWPRGDQLNALKAIPDSKFESAVAMGVNSIGNVQRLENNLSVRGVSIRNGSISHKQLIETLPNENAQEANILARKILKASQHIYNTVCIQRNVSPVECAQFLSEKPIPSDPTNLRQTCAALVADNKDGNHVFRRLLPSNYKDGLYVMNDKLVSPRKISNTALHGTSDSSNNGNHNEDLNSKNLALVQWTQFIEHDLSKPVVSSLRDGQPIECCGADNFVNSPRNLHPDCAPLIGTNSLNDRGKETCLNYVRSALSLEKCTFGPAQQLNQATGFLDLSQLYGFTRKSQNGMRAFRDGKLKTSAEGLLPMADGENRKSFCAIKLDANEICFMAGDSRVNSNPYSIILYTLFLRLHNNLAEQIKFKNSGWNDEEIFNAAKDMNVDIYRRIVFNEWLPVALGQTVAEEINSAPLVRSTANVEDYQISSEFAVAAIRFYFSMMPNLLQRQRSNDIKPQEGNSVLFSLIDEMFRSESLDRASKVNEFLASMLNQKAMRMDATYAGSLIEEFTHSRVPSRPNVLAFDIQRGRDHGLQGYTKYLEQCEGKRINTWDDLSAYMARSEINKLKSVYDRVGDVDLIVGGISEIPAGQSTVGPTFTCILGEQFSNIRQWHYNLNNDINNIDIKFKNLTAAKFLCSTAGLKEVPRNIFLIPSDKNPLVPCVNL